MIQQMGHIGKKEGKTIFLLFTPKWSKIKDQKEVEESKSKNSKDITTINAQLSDKNWPISRMNQVLNTNDNVTNANSNTGSEASLEAGSETGIEADSNLDDINEVDLVSRVLTTKANKSQIRKKKSIKATSLMQLSELTILIKYLSTSILPNVKDFTL